jgi:hypothetical protein
MKQQVDINVELTLWIDASLSRKELIALTRKRLRKAFAAEAREVTQPINILSLTEEAAIYGNEIPARFDAYEIHGAREFIHPRGNFCERVPDDAAEFWSLFGHIRGTGDECIGDFKTRELAKEIYARITGRLYGQSEQGE